MKNMLTAFPQQLYSVKEQFFSIKTNKIRIIGQIFCAHILSKEKERAFFSKVSCTNFKEKKYALKYFICVLSPENIRPL